MKHTYKILSAILALTLVLTSNLMPAMACTLEGADPNEEIPVIADEYLDEDGYPIIIPCDEVKEKGYCTTTPSFWWTTSDGSIRLYVNPYCNRHASTSSGNEGGNHGLGSATQGSADVEPGLIGDPDGNGPDPNYWEQDENGEWVLKENVEEDIAPVETPAVTETPVDVDEQRFADVAPDAWYYDAVNTMAINGILNGYPDGQFHPDNYVTEAELLTIIYRLATTDEPWSKDDCGHWAGRIINTLHHTRVRTIYTMCNNLNADEYANRGEATTAIIALLKDAGRITYDSTTNRWTSNYYTKVHDWTHPYDDDVANYISDWEAIKFGRPEGTYSTTCHKWFSARIVAMYEFGFVHGKDTTGTFDPAGYLTRAELCQMLANAGITECLNITLDIDDWGYGG